jgi:trehalose-phosphatase
MDATPAPPPGTRPHWRQCLPELHERLARSPRLLVASDFDGTLAALVDQPAAAELSPGAPEVLARLAELHPRVRLAFLSGRRLADLAGRLPSGLTHAMLAGNHGLEMLTEGIPWHHPASAAARPHLEELTGCLEPHLARFPGCEVEDKGASLTLHYRRLAAAARAELRAMIGMLELPDELCLREGKMVFEFRPRVEWHKGFAMRHIIRQLGLADSEVVFLGDDQTDEDVFRELDPAALTIHVGPAGKVSAARFNARDPLDAVDFLRALVTRVALEPHAALPAAAAGAAPADNRQPTTNPP